MPVKGGRERRIAVLAAHHVRTNGWEQTGGVEKYAGQVVRALLSAGASVHVGYSGEDIYTRLGEESPRSRLTVEKTGWLNSCMSGDARLYMGVIWDRIRWLRAIRADTLFAIQQGGGWSFGASLVAGRLLGLRVISSIRQLPIELPAPSGKRWLGIIPSPEFWRRRLLWRRQFAAKCCDAILFNSRRVAELHRPHSNYPRDRAHVIYSGEAAESPGERRLVERPLRIGAVGRVTQAKGADVLFEAFRLVAGKHPEATLTYYGDGPIRGRLCSQATEAGLAARVRFAGYVTNRDAIFRELDICVQASRREAMSNSVLEAMARGIPCVVTDVGGLAEAVIEGETGLVVPPEQPDAMAIAIGRLLTNSEVYRHYSVAAAERARTSFSHDRAMKQTLDAIFGPARPSTAPAATSTPHALPVIPCESAY